MRMKHNNSEVRWMSPNGKATVWIQLVKDDIMKGGASLELVPELAVERKTTRELTAKTH